MSSGYAGKESSGAKGTQQKSGSYGDSQTGPTKTSVAANAGAGRVKGGATQKPQAQVGLKDQKSGNRGG
jgi:hypothetical protein